MSKEFWELHDRYQEKVNKCLVQGDEINKLREALEDIAYGRVEGDYHSYAG